MTEGENSPGGRQLLITGGLELVALKFPATTMLSSSSPQTTTTTTMRSSPSSLLSSRRVGGCVSSKAESFVPRSRLTERVVFGVGATSEVLDTRPVVGPSVGRFRDVSVRVVLRRVHRFESMEWAVFLSNCLVSRT